MRERKLLALALCLAITALASVAPSSGAPIDTADEANNNNSLSVGARGPRDVLLARKRVEAPWRFLGTVTDTLTYVGGGRTRITRVEAIDRNTDGYGATPSIATGGPGHSFVTINFVSSFNRGIDFLVNIYGTQ